MQILTHQSDNISADQSCYIIDNYYGTPHIDGKELLQNGITQAMNLGVEIKTEEVILIRKTESNEFPQFEVTTLTNKYLSKAVDEAKKCSIDYEEIQSILKLLYEEE